jgi:hypothetical protein
VCIATNITKHTKQNIKQNIKNTRRRTALKIAQAPIDFTKGNGTQYLIIMGWNVLVARKTKESFFL